MRAPFDGACVVVTGASSGIGRELARLFAPRAAHLVLVARRVERLEALARELSDANGALRVSVLPCDLANMDAVKALGARLRRTVGAVDVLVNNAGAASVGFWEDIDWERAERIFTLNALAPAWLARECLPGMIARGQGGILNVGSGFGLATLPSFGPYIATKHFLAGLTETLRGEVSGTGVVVTHACPGPVDTELIDAIGRPLLVSPPAFLVISAARCAREILHAFERGRAFVVPSRRMRLVTFLVRHTPDWGLRLVQSVVARRLRRRGKLPPSDRRAA